MSELLWHLDVWRSGTFLLYSGKAAFWIQETSPRLSDVERSVVPWSVFAIGSALTYLLFFHSSICPGTLYHMTQFYQAFPHVSTACNKCWGEKAWVQGYLKYPFTLK